MSTTSTTAYNVRDDDSITLGVEILHGQDAATSLYLGSSSLSPFNGSKNVVIGKGSDIKGKRLMCNTTVKDVQTATDVTEVKFTLTGGVTKFEDSTKQTVTPFGDCDHTLIAFFI